MLRLLHSHRRSAAAGPPPAGRFGLLHRRVALLAIGFTLFILAEARRSGVRQIDFLARDGYLPLAIARRLVARTGQDVTLSYLEVSRQSVVVPTMANDLPALAEFAAHSAHGRPLRAVLGFLGVAEAETEALLRAAGLDPAQPVSGSVGMAAVSRLFDAAGTTIRQRIETRAADARAYLAQSGFMRAIPNRTR